MSYELPTGIDASREMPFETWVEWCDINKKISSVRMKDRVIHPDGKLPEWIKRREAIGKQYDFAFATHALVLQDGPDNKQVFLVMAPPVFTNAAMLPVLYAELRKLFQHFGTEAKDSYIHDVARIH